MSFETASSNWNDDLLEQLKQSYCEPGICNYDPNRHLEHVGPEICNLSLGGGL